MASTVYGAYAEDDTHKSFTALLPLDANSFAKHVSETFRVIFLTFVSGVLSTREADWKMQRPASSKI